MGRFLYVGLPTRETRALPALYASMLKEAGDPGLLTTLLIALAGGWAASRLLRSALDPFHSLVLGVMGAVAGMLLLGAFGWKLNGLGLLAASLTGGVLLLAASRPLANWAETRRNRNLERGEELEERGSTGRTQEDPS